MGLQISFSDFFATEAKKNPFHFYSTIRAEKEPIFRLDEVPGVGSVWVVTGYADIIAILKDPRFIKDAQKLMMAQKEGKSAEENAFLNKSQIWWNNMLAADPPDHTRLRALVSKAFTPRMIELLRPRIQQITDELIDAIQDREQIDLVNDFAYTLPITVICDMLGIPRADHQQFRTWTQALVDVSLKPQLFANPAFIAVQEAFIHYIEGLLEEKRKHPGDDMTSLMIQAQENGDFLTEIELISTIWLLIVAGHETTSNLINNGMLSLLTHPEQMQLLQRDPSLLPSAIEELLRYSSPVILGNRIAGEDVQIQDTIIHQGEMVMLSLTSANIDPQQFDDPETFDITRKINKHLAFGKGIHVCLGAPLARLEGQIAIGTLLKRLPNIHLACEPEQLVWPPVKFRVLAALPVSF